MSSEGHSGPSKKKRPRGKPFAKGGDPRINPGGRIKSFAGRVRDVCDDDPLELARIALSIAKGELTIEVVKPIKIRVGEHLEKVVEYRWHEQPTIDERLGALEFLRDTGWGKPKQVHEVESNGASFVIMMPAEQPE